MSANSVSFDEEEHRLKSALTEPDAKNDGLSDVLASPELYTLVFTEEDEERLPFFYSFDRISFQNAEKCTLCKMVFKAMSLRE